MQWGTFSSSPVKFLIAFTSTSYVAFYSYFTTYAHGLYDGIHSYTTTQFSCVMQEGDYPRKYIVIGRSNGVLELQITNGMSHFLLPSLLPVTLSMLLAKLIQMVQEPKTFIVLHQLDVKLLYQVAKDVGLRSGNSNGVWVRNPAVNHIQLHSLHHFLPV